MVAASKSLLRERTSSIDSSELLNLAKLEFIPARMAFLQDAILFAAVEKAAKHPLHFSYNFLLAIPKTRRISITATKVIITVQVMKVIFSPSIPFE